ncbi:unnamed protein product, partial [Allacma fusca]
PGQRSNRYRVSYIERQNDFASRTSFKKSNELYYEFTNSDFVEVTCSSKDKKWKSFLAAP